MEGANHKQSLQNNYWFTWCGGNLGGKYGGNFPKKIFSWRTKVFGKKKAMGRLFYMGELMIRSCQGEGGIS